MDHDFTHNKVKTPTITKEEAILRRILNAWYTSSDNPLDAVTRVHCAINEARWLIDAKDRCEFQEEEGQGCNEKAVRVSFTIPCCEAHAKRRDSSFT